MSERREMEPLDWMSAAFNVAIGLFLGLALSGFVELVADGFWFLAVAAAVIGGGAALALIIYDGLFRRAFDWIFPGGVQPAANPAPRRRAPLVRLMSLPSGILLGVVLAQLGLTQTILDLF
jgi:hypothetical protein